MTPADESTPTETPAPAHYTTNESAHPDPITGEAGAHPIGVGIGAIGAGLAGATIGLIAGPIGAAIGAAIGAVAGGLAGKEVASADDEPLRVNPAPSAASAAGLESTGIPVTDLTASPEESIVSSSAGDTSVVAAGQFHDAFTATTLSETETENRFLGNDAPDEILLAERAVDVNAPGDISFGHASEQMEHVRTAAYFHFLERLRHGLPGDELHDWTVAEQEFCGR